MSKATDRKAKQRERDRTHKIKRVELRLSEGAIAKLEKACVIRGGVRGAYEFSEYLETLLEQDQQKLELQLHQLKETGPCKACGRSLPEGCGGDFKEESSCFHHLEYRQLMLNEPQRLPQVEK